MSQIVEFQSSTGSTLASQLFSAGSDTAVATASGVAEATNRLGIFNATFSGVAVGTYRILSTESSVPDSAWWVDITSSSGTFLAYELAQSATQPIVPTGVVERSIEDDKPLTFAWPVSGATITGEKSIDNGTYAAVSGAIAFLRTESGKHFYTLAYNVADRPADEGTARYKLTDGTYTRYVTMRVTGAVAVDLDSVLEHLPETGRALAAADYTAPLDATETQTAAAAALTAYDPPTKAELDTAQASIQSVCATATGFSTHSAADVVTALGTGSTLTTLASQASADVIEGIVDDVKTVTVKLDTALELDGAVYRYTTNALEQGPSGSGLDAAGIRAAVGLASANLDTQLGDIVEDTGTTLPATLTTIASYIDTEVALIKAKTDNLPIDPATETTLSVLDGLIDAIKAVTDTLSLAAISTNVRTEMDTNSTKLASILEDTGTTLPATLNTIDGIVDQILVDTNELQLNQNNWLTADVSGLATQASVNAIDAVVDAILVDTSTTLPAVLTTIDSVVDQILVDTNELQLNQGNWVTATGFSTLTSADIRTAVGLGSANLDTQLGNIPTVAEFEARTLPSGSYFDPTVDTVARVTLVDTVTVNTDMVSITGITTELAKVPKVGQTHRYSQVAVDAENKTADVSISTVS